MTKQRNSLYFIFLFILSLFFIHEGVSYDLLIDLKFFIPQKIFYCFIMILFIYMENIYIVEEIRNLIEMKDYIIVRIKKVNYKKVMLKSLLKKLVGYIIVTCIWCYAMIGYIPLFMMIADFCMKVCMLIFITRIYKNENIYIILFVFVMICRYLLSFIF